MRIFIGMPFSEDARKSLIDVQLSVNLISGKSNTTDKENLHLTLLFIGELDLVETEKLHHSLSTILNRTSCIKTRFTHIDFFDKGNRKIVWIGVNDEKNTIEKLASQVKDAVDQLHIHVDQRPFKAHITLAREVNELDAKNLSTIDIPKNDVLLDKVVIYQSTRIDGKLTYLPLYTYQLR
jgi:2'-5' RNA ligase